MPTEYGQPTLYEAVPFPGAPRYFKRRYDLANNQMIHVPFKRDLKEPLDSVTAIPLAQDEGEITIYGYSCRSTYEEDAEVEVNSFREKRAFPAVCFSEVERAGEFGFVPLDDAVDISRVELEDALEELGVDWIDRTMELKPTPKPSPIIEWDNEIKAKGDLRDYLRAKMAEVEQDYLEAKAANSFDDEVRRRLIEDTRKTLEDIVDEGHFERLSMGRFRIKRPGSRKKGATMTAEEVAKAIFPSAFRPPVREYGRWEDAMVEQLGLAEFMASRNGMEYMLMFQDEMNKKHQPGQGVDFLYQMVLKTLGEGEPCYIGADICDLVDHVRHKFEPEEVRPSDPFCPSGFCLLAKPIFIDDTPKADNDHGHVPIRAIGWTSYHSEDYSSGAFWITFFSHWDDFDPERKPANPLRQLIPSHTFQWTFYTLPNDPRLPSTLIEEDDEEEQRMRGVAQTQLVQAMWRLSRQLVPVKHRAPRGLRRHAQRRLRRAMDDVNVVLLRRERPGGEHEETDRKMMVTIFVKGYWAIRHTREGPRQTFISGHLKGQGPFKETERAWELRR